MCIRDRFQSESKPVQKSHHVHCQWHKPSLFRLPLMLQVSSHYSSCLYSSSVKSPAASSEASNLKVCSVLPGLCFRVGTDHRHLSFESQFSRSCRHDKMLSRLQRNSVYTALAADYADIGKISAEFPGKHAVDLILVHRIEWTRNKVCMKDVYKRQS